MSPNRRTSTRFASHLQLSAPAVVVSCHHLVRIQAASRANARSSAQVARRPARAGLSSRRRRYRRPALRRRHFRRRALTSRPKTARRRSARRATQMRRSSNARRPAICAMRRHRRYRRLRRRRRRRARRAATRVTFSPNADRSETASFASLTASRAPVSPNRRTSTPFASHLQLSAPAEQRSLIQAASRANARASGPRRPARAGLQWPSHEL